MHRPESIRRVDEIFVGRSTDLPECPGIYAFWWVGPRVDLMAGNRRIVLKGPGGCSVRVEYQDWWPEELAYPCLYVGKTTNVRKRFSQHIMPKSPSRLHKAHPENEKPKPYTTSCQPRFGIEHVFPNETKPLNTIFNCVGFSHRTEFSCDANMTVERFFEEDRLVGIWRPWFNIDSER